MPAAASPSDDWATAAQRHLEALMVAAADLEGPARRGDAAPADAVSAAADGLLRFVEAQPAPAWAARAEAELRAAAGVLRNAALAHRNLADPAAGSEALATACRAMLEQGRHHAAAFRAATEGA